MSSNWLTDFFGDQPSRPDHPDFAKLSEVLLRMDSGIGPHQTDEQNEAQHAKRLAEAGIDDEVLAYSASQRAFRMLGIDTKMDLVIKAPQAMALTSAWIDGFVAGSLYREKVAEVWYLTVDADEVSTTLHRSEAECIKALREGYDPEGEFADTSDEDIIQTLIDEQGLVIYMDGGPL